MAKTKVLQKIITIIDGKFADIETLDNSILKETVGVAMAIDKLRESLNRVESHLNDREFEKASHVGYQEVAYNFVYVQRTLAGLQTAVYQKEALISNIAQEANTSYEDVAPYVDHKMKSAVKKSVFPAKKDNAG
jgi:predicted DNA-binding ArsR family transcriptional regulator